MIDLKSTRYQEVVVRLMPLPASDSDRSRSYSRSRETVRSYSALVYTNLNLGQAARPTLSGPLADEPMTMGGLPLSSLEQVSIRWGQYQEYLANFIIGAKGPSQFSHRLFEALSPGLETLLSGTLSGPLRIWWSAKTPELEDLPWELVAYATPQARDAASSNSIFFVRGLPPDSVAPLLPLSGPLRLGFIYDPNKKPNSLAAALSQLAPGVDVVEMTGPPRDELRKAIQQGFELLHIVADGIVSLAYDGILYLHDPSTPQIPASELSGLLSGSRVAILSLSAPEGDYTPDTMTIRGISVPSAFRAFAYLGSANVPLPSVAAPLGPLPDFLESNFWREFYAGLGASLAVDKAILGALQLNGQALPVALFSRHTYGQLFRQRTVEVLGQEDDPGQISLQLSVSQKMVQTLGALADDYPEIASSVGSYISGETARQDKLKAQLSPWVELEGDER
jgi:hypothetical protein